MKKILFVVCTHGDELAGLNLFLKYPYGKNELTEWKVLVGNPEAALLNLRYFETNLNRSFNKNKIKSYEEKRAAILKKIMAKHDVVYDFHTTTEIRPNKLWDKCLFVNKLDPTTLKECDFINSKYIIWDKDITRPEQFLTYHAKVGITAEYAKTGNARSDMLRMEKDFLQIIKQKPILSSLKNKRILTQAHTAVTQDQKDQLNLSLEEFKALNLDEKRKLKLNQADEYYPVFINTREIEPEYYCFLNKKIR